MSVKYVTRRAEDKKWCVKNAKASKATRVFNTQKEAIQYAASLKSTTSIMVQSKEGKFRKHSTWDGVKKSETTKKPAAKKATPAKKPAAKKATPAKKATVAKRPVEEKPVVEEKDAQIATKERVIQELKAQNDALDKQLAKEAEEKAAAEENKTAAKEEKVAAKEEKAIAKKESGNKSNKIKLAVGIIFLLLVIGVGVLFVADWKDWIKFMDVIKK
ncbi:DUF2188 domain-containing protein [Mycoplasma todarodis]|uniref:DUF2188 domain-containing protein n=1 Tax=Mycoplasma todarodis TaxID=1937191 RepID=UPI001FE8D355|nr:DUF2188 domain-containing protein [Mycoplasma todarodis]